MGDGLYWFKTRTGLKRETWCHFGKAWCHFVWLDWLALFCFIGVCVRECLLLYFAFILEDCVLPVSVCRPTPPAKMYFLNLCFNPPSSLPSLPTSPSSDSAEGSVCQSRHSCFEAGETNYHRPQKLSTPASSLKSPPTSYHPPCRRLRRQIPHRWLRVLGVAQDPVGGYVSDGLHPAPLDPPMTLSVGV